MSKGGLTEKTKGKKVRFLLKAPKARQVVLMGDFNNWSGQTMARDDTGRWTATVMVPPGRYEYKLMVDGRWKVVSGKAQTAPNCFGTLNNVLVVSGN